MLTVGEPSEEPKLTTLTAPCLTQEQYELEGFLIDAEKRFDSKKFGLHFDDKLQYYGVNLGKAEIDTEDENGRKAKR